MTASLLPWLLTAAVAAAPAGDSAKRAACAKAVESSIGIFGALAAGLGQKLSDDLGQGETEVTKCLRKTGDMKKCAKLDTPEARKTIEDAVAECMKWPDAVVACVSDFKRMETPECTREWEKFQGLVDSQPLAGGPDPRWQLRLPEDAYDAVAVDGGLIVVRGEKQVFAVRAQKLAWKKSFQTMEVVPIAEAGCALVFYQSRFFCLDFANGREKWKGVHPNVDENDPEDSWLMGAAQAAGQTVLADQKGRMFLVDPRACGEKSPRCLVPSGKVSELLTSPNLWILPSGHRVVLEVTRLFLTDRSGKEYAAMSFSMGGPLAVEAGGTLLLAYDKTVDEKKCTYKECAREKVLVRFDPRKCKNRIKDRHISLGDPVENCGAVIVGRPQDNYDDFEAPPITLPGGDLLVDATKLHRWGKTPWKVDLGMMSLPLLVGDRVYVTTRNGAGGKLEFRAIDAATGRTLERSWVPGGGGRKARQGFLLRAGDLVCLFVDAQVFAYPIKAKG